MKEMQSYSQSNPSSASLAYGTFKNETSAGAGDGTAIVAPHLQDAYYALYSILQLAGQSPNGNLEATDNKQVLEAMSQTLNMKYNILAEYSRGMLTWEIDTEVFKCYVSKENSNTGNAVSNITYWELVYSIGIDGVADYESLYYENSSSGLTAVTIQDAIDEIVAISIGVPTGISIEWNATTAPTGFLLEDGSAVSRTAYSDLYTVIGDTFGSGDGSTTFNLPDSREAVSVGYKSGSSEFGTLGQTGGDKTIDLSHTHTTSLISGGTEEASAGTGKLGDEGEHEHNVSSSLSATQSVLQPYITKNKAIKY